MRQSEEKNQASLQATGLFSQIVTRQNVCNFYNKLQQDRICQTGLIKPEFVNSITANHFNRLLHLVCASPELGCLSKQ